MAVHSKNPSFADLQREKIAGSVQSSFSSISENQQETAKPVEIKKEESFQHQTHTDIKTVTAENVEKKKKDVLIGIHVTEDERNELRKQFCSNGFSLATAYRAAMSYLRQDLELGKAYITNNGEIFRK